MFMTHGLNHITIFVSNLDQSLDFYTNILRMKVVHQGSDYAYLESGSTWFCISQKPNEADPQTEFPSTLKDVCTPKSIGINHIALTLPQRDFEAAVAHLKANNIPIVREPLTRGIGQSVNFLDPDGIQWEFHTSNLAERMTVIKEMERQKGTFKQNN